LEISHDGTERKRASHQDRPTGDGQFETIAGLRATRLSFNAESVDVTSLESAGGWREILGGAGVKSAAISGSGVFKDAASDERAARSFLTGDA
jgi:TP901-1 family phage major tail protein